MRFPQNGSLVEQENLQEVLYLRKSIYIWTVASIKNMNSFCGRKEPYLLWKCSLDRQTTAP